MATSRPPRYGFPVFFFALLIGVFFYFRVFDSLAFINKYWELAGRLRGEITPPIEVFYSSPFYVLLAAAVRSVRGMNQFHLVLIQLLAGAGNCWLTYRLGLEFFDRRVALAAGLAGGVYLPFVLYNSALLPAVWVTGFSLLTLLGWTAYRRRGRALFLVGAGAAAGFSLVCRPSFSLFVITLAVWLLLEGTRAPVTRRLKNLARFLLPAALVVAPVTVFNYLGSGDVVPVTASGGWVFYCSNNPRAPGYAYAPPPEFPAELVAYYRRPGVRLGYVEHLLSRKMAQEAAGTALGPRRASGYWSERAIAFARERPGEFIRLLGRKLLYSLNGYEPHDLPEVLENRRRAGSWPLLPISLVLPLALAGLVFCRPRRPLLELYLLTGLLTFLLTYVIPRYRVPLGPVLLLYAAGGIFSAVDLVRAGNWKKAALFPLLLVPCFFLVNLETPRLRRDRLRFRPAYLHEWRGMTSLRFGELEDARREFAAALELNPESVLARRGLQAAAGGQPPSPPPSPSQ